MAGPIPVADAISIARQIAEALEQAHDMGIVHRDLNPREGQRALRLLRGPSGRCAEASGSARSPDPS